MTYDQSNLKTRPSNGQTPFDPQLALYFVDCIRSLGRIEITLVVRLENHGTGDALDVKVQIVAMPFDYTLESWRSPMRMVGRLSPGDVQTLEFTILLKNMRVHFINAAFDITFNDREGGRKIHLLLKIPLTKEKDENVLLENPYIPGKPLDPRFAGEMFYGRREMLQFIVDNLKGRFSQNMLLLHGQRRIGKTSLLLQLRYRLLKPPFYPVFLDMQGMVDMGTYTFLHHISNGITDAIKESNINVQAPSRQTLLEGGFAAFSEFLDMVGSELHDGYLVLMFDEFEELENRVRNRKIDRDIFPFIRSLMQHRPWTIFIFAGTHKLEDLSKDYFSIFFNTAIYREIGFLSESDAEQLIREPVISWISYAVRAVKRIKDATAFHPYFIQLICFHLVDRVTREGRNQITFQDVNEVIQEITSGGVPHLNYLWEQSSPQEQTVLSSIAELQRTMPRTKHFPHVEIMRAIESMGDRLTQAEFSHAIEGLIARDLVRIAPTSHAYGITFDLLSRWIREKYPHSPM